MSETRGCGACGTAWSPANLPCPTPEKHAGRALDALVAEKVMGFRWYQHTARQVEFYPKGIPPYRFLMPEEWGVGQEWFAVRTDDMTLPSLPSQHYAHVGLPHYSTDVRAAMDIIDRLMDSHFMVSLNVSHEMGWWCVVNTASAANVGSGYCESAPLAICAAALRAVDGV